MITMTVRTLWQQIHKNPAQISFVNMENVSKLCIAAVYISTHTHMCNKYKSINTRINYNYTFYNYDILLLMHKGVSVRYKTTSITLWCTYIDI